MTTQTLATWTQATDGARDTNPFDYIEAQLSAHCTTVGLHEMVTRYPEQIADCLPQHIEFVENRFVVTGDAGTDPEADRATVADAIARADGLHRTLVQTWLS